MPELPAVPGTPGLLSAVEATFSAGGPLATRVAGYERRDGQQRMAAAVAAVIEQGGTLLAEAGTGTGKTLAYLIPAILSGQRVLVSTGTKNLQEQIYGKDLPALREALGMPFSATLMKGRGNYLCLHRWETYQQAPDTFEQAVFVPIIREWAAATATGDRAELRDLPEDLPLWKAINAEAESCLGSDCPRWGECWVTRMRQAAAEADVVIVNHHLLCADASVRRGEYGEVIPSCPTLVVDEAHQLEDVATQYFGFAVSNYRVEDLQRDAARVAAAVDGLDRDLARVEERSRTFFARLLFARAERVRYTADSLAEHAEDGVMLLGALDAMASTLALAGARQAPGAVPVDPEAIAGLHRRTDELRTDLRLLLRAEDPAYVYYLEPRGRGVYLRASPIDVSRLIRESLLERQKTTVLTSATLTVDGSFDYVKSRLGVGPADELRVASEFDYRQQALVYLPRRMPPPKTPAFAEAAARETLALLSRSRGRAFVLFTSYAVLRTVQRFLELSLSYPLLVQGSAPRTTLLEQFRSTPGAVLLATSSFWQGVDVAGDALSCVIIDKLPFASPGDPVTSARIEAIRADGGDPFAEFQVPLAILTLQQGLGRLIRHRSDRGVLAVLDPRIRTMGYGRRFLDSLPPAPVTHDLDAVGRFFG